jgi:hypothetical protein
VVVAELALCGLITTDGRLRSFPPADHRKRCGRTRDRVDRACAFATTGKP